MNDDTPSTEATTDPSTETGGTPKKRGRKKASATVQTNGRKKSKGKKAVKKAAKKAGAKKAAKSNGTTRTRRTRNTLDPDAKVVKTGKENPFREGSGSYQRVEAVLKLSGQTVKAIQGKADLRPTTLANMRKLGLVTID